MKNINTLGTSLEENENITNIEYRYGTIPGLTITFKNGIVMSIITGEFAYGSEQSPFEIAFMNGEKGNWMPEIFDANDAGDDVAGYMNADDVAYYIKRAIAFRD